MLLHVDRMRLLDWHHRSLVPLVRQYRKHHSDPAPTSDNNNNNNNNNNKNNNDDHHSNGSDTTTTTGTGNDTTTDNDSSTATSTGAGVWQAQMNDQDIFNAALAMAPHFFHILPCAWNVQVDTVMDTALLLAILCFMY